MVSCVNLVFTQFILNGVELNLLYLHIKVEIWTEKFTAFLRYSGSMRPQSNGSRLEIYKHQEMNTLCLRLSGLTSNLFARCRVKEDRLGLIQEIVTVSQHLFLFTIYI